MLTYEDCLSQAHLTDDAVAAIAEHEHLPAMTALELGESLVCGPEGCRVVTHMIRDDIRDAVRHGDRRHARDLCGTLRRFAEAHPEVTRA